MEDTKNVLCIPNNNKDIKLLDHQKLIIRLYQIH